MLPRYARIDILCVLTSCLNCAAAHNDAIVVNFFEQANKLPSHAIQEILEQKLRTIKKSMGKSSGKHLRCTTQMSIDLNACSLPSGTSISSLFYRTPVQGGVIYSGWIGFRNPTLQFSNTVVVTLRCEPLASAIPLVSIPAAVFINRASVPGDQSTSASIPQYVTASAAGGSLTLTTYNLNIAAYSPEFPQQSFLVINSFVPTV